MKAEPGKIKKGIRPKLASIVARVVVFIHDHQLVSRKDKVVVAVSGGADSLALLHILRSLDLQLDLLAVYIDHGLRPKETPHEQAFIAKCCDALAVRFVIREVNVIGLAANEKRSHEEAARILRYQALEEIRFAHGAEIIAVGHTADDQVEEFFLRLMRGSSGKGLSGMQPRRGRIIRPLLQEDKATLQNYLKSLNLSWCQDSSNLHRQFLRNRIRLDLLPLLEQDFNPAIRRTVLQTMDMLGEEDHFLEKQMIAVFPHCVKPGEQLTMGVKMATMTIDIPRFADCHAAIRRRLLEKCFWQMTIRPTYRQIGFLLDFIMEGANGGEIHLADGVRAEKRGSQVILCRPLENSRIRGSRPAIKNIHQVVSGPGCYPVPEVGKELILEEMALSSFYTKDTNHLYLAREKISFPLLLRSSLPGEVFHPCKGKGRKKISRFFNDRKIPAKDRPSWPVLVCGSDIIALPGLQLDNSCSITEETTTVLAIKWQEIRI